MIKKLAVLAVLVALVASGVASVVAQDEFIFGVVLVGPKGDRGWSQAHYTAGQYVEEKLPGAKMIVLESLNTAARPETTLDQVLEDMVSQGAELIECLSHDRGAGNQVDFTKSLFGVGFQFLDANPV